MIKKALLATAALWAFAGAAHAATPITATSSTPYSATAPAGQAIIDDFEGPIAAGYTFTFTGPSGIQTATDGDVARPFGDTSAHYFAVRGSTENAPINTSATLTAATPITGAFSLFIGSLDTYNTITFNGAGGFTQSFTGTQLAAIPATLADGSQGSTSSNRLFNFSLNGNAVSSIVFASSQDSFEFDNLAVAAAPEPGTWALMIAGVGMMGGAMRLSRRKLAGLKLA